MKSESKLHEHLQIMREGSWIRDNKKVHKKVEFYDFKWSTLREATRFVLFIYNMIVYIMLIKLNHQVTLYHCSNKYHNIMLYNLIAIEGALCYLILENM
jgi:hypothetical protein